MQSMGFEPMRVSTLELESNALDHSATTADINKLNFSIFNINLIIFLLKKLKN